MRISDWSSDVCSSDLPVAADEVWRETGSLLTQFFKLVEGPNHDLPILKAMAERLPFLDQHASVRSRPQERYVLSGFPIFDSQGTLVGSRGKEAAIAARAPRAALGRASWRERVCTYV